MLSAVTHPIMFEEGDPLLDRVRTIALALPESEERIQHGRPAFAIVGRPAFASYGAGAAGAVKVPHPHALLVHVDEDERPARIQDPRFFVPAYIGKQGWLGIDVDARDTDWDEIAELLDASWRHRAPARLR